MVKAVVAFLDFCYLARRNDFTQESLDGMDAALVRFHHHREIFRTTGVRPDGFSLPRQHSLTHYRRNIEEFGAPNGLCSSITESRHITAVKKPWRRSNRYEALGQMLLINQRLDKLTAARANFIERGMMPPDRILPLAHSAINGQDDEDEGPVDIERVLAHVSLARTRERSYPRALLELAQYIGEPAIPLLIQHFLHDQLAPNAPFDPNLYLISNISPISVFHSAVATFYAPSDSSGIRGMCRERIRSTPSWRKTGPRRDCALVVEDENKPGFRGMGVVRVKIFFSFLYNGVEYPCALVEWFSKVGRSPDDVTGMWVVRPEVDHNGERVLSVLHLDSFLRGVHLIPVYGEDRLPLNFSYTWSLDLFQAFYVNKYADHHSNEILYV